MYIMFPFQLIKEKDTLAGGQDVEFKCFFFSLNKALMLNIIFFFHGWVFLSNYKALIKYDLIKFLPNKTYGPIFPWNRCWSFVSRNYLKGANLYVARMSPCVQLFSIVYFSFFFLPFFFFNVLTQRLDSPSKKLGLDIYVAPSLIRVCQSTPK